MACVYILFQAIQKTAVINGSERSLRDIECWYVAPTYDQGKRIFWKLLKNLAEPLTSKIWENESRLELVNGRCIALHGSDKPERLKGVGLSAVVLDEFATMKPDTWFEAIRPTLADVMGKALFIGTPEFKNHFYDIYLTGLTDPDWGCFHYESKTNPYLPQSEIEYARKTMPRETFKKEFEASFETAGGIVFNYPIIEVDAADVPADGEIYIAMDPAGFASAQQAKTAKHRLDETAIAVVKVNRGGWWVLDVEHGRWDVRETSIKFLRMCQKHRPVLAGIEQGMAKNAVMPYLEDQMKRLGIYPNIRELTHGGQNKSSRIAWALQGRLEHGRIHFVRGDYLIPMKEQIFDFPNARHDDMVDALAYIDQIASVMYLDEIMQDDWEPLDTAVGL